MTYTIIPKETTVEGEIPVGGVFPFLKSLIGCPSLPNNFVECNGQTLNDPDSSFNGQVIPNLNGENRFLRGNATSGSTGGNATHTHSDGNHNHTSTSSAGSGPTNTEGYGGGSHTHAATNHEPQHYNVVWAMRVK